MCNHIFHSRLPTPFKYSFSRISPIRRQSNFAANSFGAGLGWAIAAKRHIEILRKTYRGRVEAMDEALHKHVAGLAEWSRPDGGYFFWLRCDESINTGPLRNKALEREAGFTAGSLFSSQRKLRNYLRLSFAHYDEDEIREGVSRLARVFESV